VKGSGDGKSDSAPAALRGASLHIREGVERARNNELGGAVVVGDDKTTAPGRANAGHGLKVKLE
jgi:hypothetical protein